MIHVLWVICNVEFDGGILFHIWPKIRSSFDQKGQNLKSKFSFRYIPVLFSFVSGFQKWHLFWRTTIRNSKNQVSKNDVMTINRFLGHCTARIKILAWNCIHLLVTHSSIACIPVLLDIYKILDCLAFIFEKSKLWFFGIKIPKMSKIRDTNFVERVILHLIVLAGCVLLQNSTFQKHLNVGRLSTKNRVTWRTKFTFSQTLLDGFRWNFVWRC